MKNAIHSIAAILLALVYWFVLSSVNVNALDFKSGFDNGTQKINVSESAQIFSHASEKESSFNDFSPSNVSFKGNCSSIYLSFQKVEAFFKHDLNLFSKQSENKQLNFQRIIRLFPFHCFL
ncbi:MAG: hypothetical protein Q8K70_12035 [Bacteroidota bacterium]|nr:hypothetical protein [Bacteroidota bacterium]